MASTGKPRVCFFTERQVGINSVATVLQRYATAQSDVDVTWCDVTYHQEKGRIERLRLPRRVKGVLRGYRQTGDGLRHGPFDALFFLTHNPAVFRHAALRETPTCIWTDVTPLQLDQLADAYEHPISASVPLRMLKHAAVRRTFQLSRRCLGWSDWARRSFVDDYGIAAENTGVVPPGIDLSIWNAPPKDPGESGPFRIVFVGGHFERKGGKLLLDVFRRTLRGRCELSLVTRDPIAEEPGVRVYRGLTAGSEPLQNLLYRADAFVLPTLADCHSIASLEAMACGLPVILTRIGAGADIVEDGASGFLIPPSDSKALADSIAALAADPARARAMGARGRALAQQKFDARVMARNIVDHLRAIAGR